MSNSAKAVFLSYASQDAEAAKRIADVLRAAGVEVWFDQSELVGGDAWDAKIRKQIKECALLIPVISASTQARTEGYFRLEWRLADQRTHLMAKGRPFLLPVVIDATMDADAAVPDSFTEVQWTKAPGGEVPPAFAARVQRLLNGEATAQAARPVATAAATAPARRSGSAGWVFAGAAVVVLGALLLWQPWRSEPAAPPAAKATPAGVVAVSEARKLSQRAFDLVTDPNYTRESVWLADELCMRALALDATDAEIWATAAFVGQTMWQHVYDSSDARRQKSRTQADRAVQLDPKSVFARLAVARNFATAGDSVEAARLLRELGAESPDNPWVWQNFVWVSRRLDREEDVAEALSRLRAGNQRQALIQALFLESRDLRSRGRYAEAEKVLDELLVDPPLRHAYYEKFNLLTRAWYDLPEAEPFIDKIPMRFQQEPAFGSGIAQYWLRRGDPEKALQALARVPQDFLEEYAAREPKAYLAGWAHALAGRQSAAQSEWRSAISLIEARLKENSRDVRMLNLKAQLLGLTGQIEAAHETWKLRVEFTDTASPPSVENVAAFYTSVRENEQAILAVVDRWPRTTTNVRSSLMWSLRYSPWLAGIRGDPRIQKLIAEHQAFLDDLKRKSRPSPIVSATAPGADDKSVAVLPFANLSGDKEQEYFSDGLTEEILNTLARERDLRVPGRASSFSFKGRNVSSAEIAKALNVSRLVEGSVRKAGNKVRISVSLTRADGFSEELGTFTEELSDIFALQDKVARVVVEKLTRRTVAVASVSATRNPEAYDAYLRGRAVQTRTPRLMGEAIQHYERAVALDPGFALAWARLAEARFRAFTSQADRSPEVVNGSREAIDRALALQPDLPEALIMRAIWVRRVQRDFAAARQDLDRVESLHPVTADLRHAQAQQAQELGQYADAFRLAREALAIDPQNGDHANAYAISFCATRGEFVEADQMLRRAIVLQGSSSPTPFVNLIHVRNLWRGPEAALRLTERWPADQGGRGAARVNLLVRLGRLDEARREFDRLDGQTGPILQDWSLWFRSDQVDLEILRLLGREDLARNRARDIVAEAAKQFARGNRAPLVVADFIRSEIVLGHRESALKALEEWRTEAQREPSIQRRNQEFSSSASRLYALLGKVDEAVELLQELQANGHIGRYGLADNPEYASLRGDPRFQEIVRQYEAWRKTLPDPADL